jgi:hypothetical protein
MKFSSSLVFVAAATSAALAAPQPQAADGGHGVPPAATLSSSGSQSAAAPEQTKPADAGAHGAATDAQPDIKIPFTPSNAVWTMTPADDSWSWIEAPGVFNVTAPFALKNQDKASAKFAPPQEFAGIEVWMYQRSDGGVMSMSIDGVATARLDFFNRTATGEDLPVKVYENPHLKRGHHVVEFKNLEDPRVKKFGQFNLDRVIITAAADAPLPDVPVASETTTPAPSVSSTPRPQPPLTATTNPAGGGADASSQQPAKPGDAALALSVPKSLLSLAGLLVAGLALF